MGKIIEDIAQTTNKTANLKQWQIRIFSSIYVTYFAYYLCRYNMPMAKTNICEAFSWDEPQFGTILSALLVMYAVGQFVNGQLADRFGGRLIASLGIWGSVVMNLFIFATVMLFTKSASKTMLYLLIILWGANGFFQAMGWAPMVRIMTHWFPANTRGKVMGLLGTCYQLGAAFSWFLTFFIVRYYSANLGGNWRIVFLVPAVLFAIVGIFFYLLIRDTPEELELPAVEQNDKSENITNGSHRTTIAQNVLKTLKNPYIWIVAGAFFMLDVNRYGFVNWLPAFLDSKELSNGLSGFNFTTVMNRCIHPLAGGAGAIIAGWATDRFFKGSRAPVIAILLLLLGISSIIFPYIATGNMWLTMLVIAFIGFCTYGPHILMVGHAAQDFGKKTGAAGAAGFIDGMGYIGASLAGYGAGLIIKMYGYEINFVIFGLAAICGAILICFIWKAGPLTHSS